MSSRKSRGKLGKDLDVLLGVAGSRAVSPEPEAGPTTSAAALATEGLEQIPLEQLKPGKFQPRREFEATALTELAESIRHQGVVQPIVVRPVGDRQWEIIAGERRWRASQMAGLERIPALIRDVSDEATIAMALIENIQRENLNPIEEAEALQRLQTDFSLSQQQVAERVGKSRPVIANLLRLLSLEAPVRAMIQSGEIDTGHGKVLLALEGAEQVKVARQVVKKGCSVRQTEALVKATLTPGTPPAESSAQKDPNVARLEQDLSARLGAPVSLMAGKGNRGKLVISYSSLDELDGILRRIR